MSRNRSQTVPGDVADLALAESGKRRLESAFQAMCVLQAVRKQLIKAQPFAGLRIAACLPITPGSGNLAISLRDGGASVLLIGAESARNEDDIAASLLNDSCISVYGRAGDQRQAEPEHLKAALAFEPHLLLDHRGELTEAAVAGTSETPRADTPRGALVNTREGITAIRRSAAETALPFPVIALSSGQIYQAFLSRYALGQNALDAVVSAFRVMWAGMNVVVCGFGDTGRGVAARAKGMGANVIVTEVSPLRALEAVMEGYRVTSIAEAALLGDVFITASGSRSVIGREHFDKLRNGAILCNAGRSDVEIDLVTLRQLAAAQRPMQPGVAEFSMRDGRRIYLLGDGHAIPFGKTDGPAPSIADLSFANQALNAEYLLQHRSSLENRIYPVPREIDRQVARLKLEAFGVKIDRLTVEQEQYLAGWSDDV